MAETTITAATAAAAVTQLMFYVQSTATITSRMYIFHKTHNSNRNVAAAALAVMVVVVEMML